MAAVKRLRVVKRLLMAMLGSATIAIVVLVTEDIDWLAGVGMTALGVVIVGALEAMRRIHRALARPSVLVRRELEAAHRLMPLLAWPLLIGFAADFYEGSGWRSYVVAGASCVAAFGYLAAALKLGDALKHLCPACGAFWDPEDDVVYLTTLCPQCARDPERLGRAWGFPSS